MAACASWVGTSATLCSVSLEVSSKAKIRWSGGLPPGRSTRIGVSLSRTLGSRERPPAAPTRRSVSVKAAMKLCRVSAAMHGGDSSGASSRLWPKSVCLCTCVKPSRRTSLGEMRQMVPSAVSSSASDVTAVLSFRSAGACRCDTAAAGSTVSDDHSSPNSVWRRAHCSAFGARSSSASPAVGKNGAGISFRRSASQSKPW
mmetsp:Transcript_2817/g.8261  ORF Transcript_2817/g.8261 Transcript_2817/m.8261 type:complete len:201 (+) Transcript_2817:3765-4367(+)